MLLALWQVTMRSSLGSGNEERAVAKSMGNHLGCSPYLSPFLCLICMEGYSVWCTVYTYLGICNEAFVWFCYYFSWHIWGVCWRDIVLFLRHNWHLHKYLVKAITWPASGFDFSRTLLLNRFGWLCVISTLFSQRSLSPSNAVHFN